MGLGWGGFYCITIIWCSSRSGWQWQLGYVDMCWTLEAEEPHRSTILTLEHCPLKANVSCLFFPPHQGKMSSAQPLSGLDSPSQGSRGQLKTTPSCHYHSPPSLSPFTIWLGWAYISKKVCGPWHQGVCFDLPMIFCA
jgi:hypothetical protein